MERLTSLLLALLLLVCALAPACGESLEAEDTETAEQASEDEADDDYSDFDEEEESDGTWVPIGPVYQEPDKSEYDASSPALYTAHCAGMRSIFAERSIDSEKLFRTGSGVYLELLYVGQDWCVARYGTGSKMVIGYTRRQYLTNVKAVDSVNTPPYGVQKSCYIATCAGPCHVRKSMSTEEESYMVLNEGTMLSIWKLQDGWAIVPYRRTLAYIDMNELTDVIPVSPTDEPIRKDSPIAAYTSYYSIAQTTSNIGRMNNIAVACRRLTRVMQPKESLDFNAQVGPYNKTTGYMEAPVLTNGSHSLNYGGGTCQVSSTMYNCLLQLPGITILQRRPHGPSGAAYLPHGVDAAVGNSQLNFRFRNDYSFPIRVEGHSASDGALLIVVYRAD